MQIQEFICFQCESIVEDLEEEFTTVFAAENPQDAENEVWIILTIDSNKLEHISFSDAT